MKHFRNIRRIDDDLSRTHAWFVQVQRRNHIKRKMFSDAIFGGKKEALSAALEYRDALLAAPTTPTPAEHNLWHRTIVRRNNTSGIPGVGLFKRANGSERWIAFWTDENGRKRSRTFSVLTYGHRKAKQLAVAERKRQLERLFQIKSSEQPAQPIIPPDATR